MSELPNTLLVPSQQLWTVGVAIPPVFAAVNAANTFKAPIIYTAANLPDGIALSSGGVFSGTPVLPQEATAIVVTATDANGLKETQGFEVVITSDLADSADVVGGPVIDYQGSLEGINFETPGNTAGFMYNPVNDMIAANNATYPYINVNFW